jgi:hypothetical protein
VTYRPARVPPGAAPAIAARLEPDVIGVAQDKVIGMAGCPGCGRLTAVCAWRFPYQARRSRFGWRLTMLRLRRAWRRLWPQPGPSCCGTPGRCWYNHSPAGIVEFFGGLELAGAGVTEARTWPKRPPVTDDRNGHVLAGVGRVPGM